MSKYKLRKDMENSINSANSNRSNDCYNHFFTLFDQQRDMIVAKPFGIHRSDL